mmetsp:Transcript_34991/g.74426  ORF Transcript_34991/g.74426 Transcript_34991/m.74426 type:complete len:218 (-) Transcript_34991:89-742(-)
MAKRKHGWIAGDFGHGLFLVVHVHESRRYSRNLLPQIAETGYSLMPSLTWKSRVPVECEARRFAIPKLGVDPVGSLHHFLRLEIFSSRRCSDSLRSAIRQPSRRCVRVEEDLVRRWVHALRVVVTWSRHLGTRVQNRPIVHILPSRAPVVLVLRGPHPEAWGGSRPTIRQQLPAKPLQMLVLKCLLSHLMTFVDFPGPREHILLDQVNCVGLRRQPW